MKSLTVSLALLAATGLWAQDRSAVIEEAFRLGGVRETLQSLPAQANEMSVAAVAQLAPEQRKPFTPLIKDASLKLLDPAACYPEVQHYFLKHYDGPKLNTFIALERTSVYRTMHRLEAGASTAAAQTTRRRFEANLNADPPGQKRRDTLQKIDQVTGATELQLQLVSAVLNTASAAMGATAPAELNTQSGAFPPKVRPLLTEQTLHRNLFVFRNADDVELEDYAEALRQPAVDWFNRNLREAILAVVAERVQQATDAVKSPAK